MMSLLGRNLNNICKLETKYISDAESLLWSLKDRDRMHFVMLTTLYMLSKNIVYMLYKVWAF